MQDEGEGGFLVQCFRGKKFTVGSFSMPTPHPVLQAGLVALGLFEPTTFPLSGEEREAARRKKWKKKKADFFLVKDLQGSIFIILINNKKKRRF